MKASPYSAHQMHQMCERKRRYPTWQDAVGAAAESVRRTKHIRIYPCPVCEGFHLTKRPERSTKGITA